MPVAVASQVDWCRLAGAAQPGNEAHDRQHELASPTALNFARAAILKCQLGWNPASVAEPEPVFLSSGWKCNVPVLGLSRRESRFSGDMVCSRSECRQPRACGLK